MRRGLRSDKALSMKRPDNIFSYSCSLNTITHIQMGVLPLKYIRWLHYMLSTQVVSCEMHNSMMQCKTEDLKTYISPITHRNPMNGDDTSVLPFHTQRQWKNNMNTIGHLSS